MSTYNDGQPKNLKHKNKEEILRLKAYKLRYTALTATHFDFNDPKVYFIQNACEPCLTRFYAFKSRARRTSQYDINI